RPAGGRRPRARSRLPRAPRPRAPSPAALGLGRVRLRPRPATVRAHSARPGRAGVLDGATGGAARPARGRPAPMGRGVRVRSVRAFPVRIDDGTTAGPRLLAANAIPARGVPYPYHVGGSVHAALGI